MKAYFQNSSNSNIKFSILFWQLFFGMLPFTLIISILAYTGQKTADLNGEKFQGILGALISLIVHPMIVIVGSILLWIILFVGRNLLKLIFK